MRRFSLLVKRKGVTCLASHRFSVPIYTTTFKRTAEPMLFFNKPNKRFYSSGMFSSISEKIGGALNSLFGKNKLSKADVDMALQKVKVALLNSDVAEPVIKQMVRQIGDDVLGQKVESSEQIPKAAFIYAEVLTRLTALLGNEAVPLSLQPQSDGQVPTILMVGIQGSGKTTTCAKLANRLFQLENKKVLVASLDVRRPAAQEQLAILAQKAGVECLQVQTMAALTTSDLQSTMVQSPIEIAKAAQKRALEMGADVLILDSAGRLHVDEELMREITEISQLVRPSETLLVADAMLGNDAVRIAKQFHNRVGVTGICLTRVDSDARGGAAISMRAVTGIPIKFVGIGETLDAIDVFRPKSIASRILGAGDMEGLAHKAIEAQKRAGIDKEKMKSTTMNILSNKFTFEEYLTQLKSLSAMGSLASMIDYMPNSLVPNKDAIKDKFESMNFDEMFAKHKLMIEKMTPEERQEPLMLQSSSARRHQLATNAGVTLSDVNKLLKMYDKLKEMQSKMFSGAKGQALAEQMKNNPEGKMDLKSMKGLMDMMNPRIMQDLMKGNAKKK